MERQKLDALTPVVAAVVSDLLREGDVVAPLEVLLRLEVLEPEQVEAWRRGGLPYLERGIVAGLSRVARLLRLLREHCLSLGLKPKPGKYQRRGKGKKQALRFSKRGDAESEQAYSLHYVRDAVTASAAVTSSRTDDLQRPPDPE